MLNAALLMVTILVQTGPRYSVFGEKDVVVVYSYQAEADRNGEFGLLPVTASFATFVEYQKATHAKDRRSCDEMEERGELFWVESGTLCQAGRMSGVSAGPVVRRAYEIRLLDGPHRGKRGVTEAENLRKRSRIVVEPPEPITEQNRGTSRPLALAIHAQDRVVFRELVAAQEKARAIARAIPTRGRQQRVRFRIFRRELESVLSRYDLDEATAFRILDWGKAGDWPNEEMKDAARGDR